MSKEKKIYVERETYEKNDNTYFTYFIKGKIRGRDVSIALAPPSYLFQKGVREQFSHLCHEFYP